MTSKVWTAGADATMRALGVCLEVPGSQTASGSLIRVNACDGSARQRWSARADGQLVHEVSGRCVTVNPASPNMILGDCTAAAGQVFSWPVLQNSTVYAYNDADQLTATITDGLATGYGYDPNGNQSTAGAVTSTFDLANRTASTVGGATTTSYAYDGAGQPLTSATNGTVDTRFTWDPNNALAQLVGETNVAGGTLRRYVNGIDGPLSMTSAGGTSFYHRDAYGSIADVTSATGAAQWSYAYEPFGAARSTTKVDPAAPVNPMQYTGQYQDPGGMYHLRARQYDPTIGRFTATDPLAPPIADPYVSSYAYVGNSPTAFDDPSGLNKCEIGKNPLRWGGNAVDCASKARMPDYITVDAGMNFDVPFVPVPVGFDLNLTITRDGNVYGGAGPAAGTPGPAGSVRGGWLNQSRRPSECRIDQFSNGWTDTIYGQIPV